MSPNTPEEPNENDPFIDQSNGGDETSSQTDEQVTLLNPPNLDPGPPTPTSGSPLVHPAHPWGHSSSLPTNPIGTGSTDGDDIDPVSETPRTSSVSSSKKIIRWVGVNGGHKQSHGGPNASTQNAHSPLLGSSSTPGTPHIIVSVEGQPEIGNMDAPSGEQDKNGQQGPFDQGEGGNSGNGVGNFGNPSQPLMGSNMAVYPNLSQDQRRNSGSYKNGNPGIGMTLEPTDYRLPIEMRKTRRNSMLELLRRTNSQTNLNHANSTQNIRRATSRQSLTPSADWRSEGNFAGRQEQRDSLIICLSALYGKLLVVMGMAFPMAEVISKEMPSAFYNGFYLYLYFGSIIFLLYVYAFLLRSTSIPTVGIRTKIQTIKNYLPLRWNGLFKRSDDKGDKDRVAQRDRKEHAIQISSAVDQEKADDRVSINTAIYKSSKYTLTEGRNHGSMYLKMGAVIFGIGSMIYSGLEVGQYFELKNDEDCKDILLVISPLGRMIFTFIQMYFIFLNSRVAISRHCIISRFGLMHMIGTNLCVWLNVLVQETKHEIAGLVLGHGHHGHNGPVDDIIDNAASHGGGHDDDLYYSKEDQDEKIYISDESDTNLSTGVISFVNKTIETLMTGSSETMHDDDSSSILDTSSAESFDYTMPLFNDTHHISRRAAHGSKDMIECRRFNLMGRLVDNASPFLFPCTIEYSLLCCGVLYVIWKNINKPIMHTFDADSDISTYIARKTKHHYSVDCAHANRGLFMGILALVLTVISLILFFVLINDERLKEIAILEANITELVVYSVSIVTVVVGMYQMRKLEFVPEGDIELDNILLLIAQTGVYIYTSFTIIGGNFTLEDQLILPLMTAIITLTQTTLQTIFILDASRRCCYTQEQLDNKPGREMVTFLLVCNLAMWAINTFETSRADAHPVQLHFYGPWAWTIISHISMPLAIFYRFHVTVCLCEIWKRSYKLKNDYL